MFKRRCGVYHTKHMGRNGYHFFSSPPMNTLAQTHLQLMNDLWLAIVVMSCSCIISPNSTRRQAVLGLRHSCAGNTEAGIADARPVPAAGGKKQDRSFPLATGLSTKPAASCGNGTLKGHQKLVNGGEPVDTSFEQLLW